VGLCYRYSNLYRAFVEEIRRETVGPMRMIWCKEFRGYWGCSRDEWRLDQALSGGSMVEKNCHHFDIFNWAAAVGPVRVQAFGGHAVHKNAETLDHAVVNVEYENGVKGSLILSLFLEHFSQLEIGALCDRGKIETTQLHGQFKAGELEEMVSKSGDPIPTLSVWPMPGTERKEPVGAYYCPLWPDGWSQHLGSGRQFQVFNECLTSGLTPPVDGAVGRESLLIPIAAEKSVQLGGAVVEITGRDV